MRKVPALLITCFLLHAPVYAQEKLGYFRGGVSLYFPENGPSDLVVFPAFTLGPGIRVIQTKDFILSLSCPISFGATYKTDLFAGIDLPVMVDLNLGSAAANDEKAKAGFIIGAGVSYINAVNYYDNDEQRVVRSAFWGLRFEFGIVIGKEKENNSRDLLLFSYGQSMMNSQASVIGISFQVAINHL
jgi:hypothetical protein